MNFILSLLLILASSVAFSAPRNFTFPQGSVELLTSHTTWNKDESLAVGLHFKLENKWHIYWKNSGDSGAPPKWEWIVTNGSIKNILWPTPERIPIEGMVNLGYDKETLFKFEISPDRPETITTHVKLEFLICKVECVPYITELDLTIPYAEHASKADPLFSRFTYPSPTPSELQWTIQKVAGDFLATKLSWPSNMPAIKTLQIFPEDGEAFKAQTPSLDIDGNTLHINLPLQDTRKTDFSGSRFLLVAESQDGVKSGYEAALLKAEGPSFASILIWALIGGLILNIMPCVFPVLSIKILSFLGPDKNSRQLRNSGLLYTLGVVVSFLALAAILLFLRSRGEQLGWGFQLQSPIVAGGIALLFFWLGFNFLGTFEIGQSLTYLAGRKTNNGAWGSFLTGVLATVVATPCTAPFMGAAIGASLTLPASLTLVVFAGLGFGMALPFLLLAFFPGFLKFLPKPGAWMETFKQLLAFPLFATVLWLLWVIAQQVDVDAVLYLLVSFLVIGFWIWISRQIKNERWKQWFLVLGFLLSLFALRLLPTDRPTPTQQATSAWSAYDEKAIEADRNSGQAVFIDFTAAWCITCQVNKKLVLNTDDIQQLFKDQNVKLYKADWTDKDPVITKALARFGRNSLPLYIYYSATDKEPKILPEILTKQIINDLFTN
ncbi:protein-disulfide reductase DsbD family protein [Bdellovibrio sp. HCB209]|uniref:protein-disulfide reductase DsbD family protein n=1 Tax=Bdellovibrio sp. HCB209 TaxID=3394354 RepID=UPI0039B3AAF5